MVVELDPQHPAADFVDVLLVGVGQVVRHDVEVVLDYGGGVVRVVVDFRGDRQVTQSGELERGLQLFQDVRVFRLAFYVRVDGHRGRFDVSGRVEDLLDARHSQGHVFGRNTRRVEGVA